MRLMPQSQEALLEKGRRCGEQGLASSVAERDQQQRWDGGLFQRLGEAGLLGVLLPREQGGQGLGALESGLLMEGFGQGSGDAGLGLAWSAHLLQCGVPLWKLGTAPQRHRYLPRLCGGEWVGGLAWEEAGSCQDPSRIQTRAHRRGDRWLLTGAKVQVVNGPVANLLLVTARTRPGPGVEGISAFIVERDSPGLRAGPRLCTGGLRTAVCSDILLEECPVPQENLLGPEGTGGADLLRLVRCWEWSLGLAHWLGVMKAALESSVHQARERRELGRPVGHFQAARARLADMRIHYELARRMVHRAAAVLDEGRLDLGEAAMARLLLAGRAQEVIRDAAQLHGAAGLVSGTPLERWQRDASHLTVEGGSSDLLRSIIASSMLGLG